MNTTVTRSLLFVMVCSLLLLGGQWPSGSGRSKIIDRNLEAEVGQTTRIWGGDIPRPVNGYRLFRREFELSGINSYWIFNLSEAAELAARLGEAEMSRKWKAAAEKARAAFEKMFWDSSTGLYRDRVAFDEEGKTNAAAPCRSSSLRPDNPEKRWICIATGGEGPSLPERR